MSCTVHARESVQQAARAIRDCEPTVLVKTHPPAKSRHDAWTLDAVLRDTEGIPPEVLRELALAGLTLHSTPSQADHEHVEATV